MSIKQNRSTTSLNAKFREKVELWVMDVNNNTPYKIFITEAYRTQERQDYLFSLGRTRSGRKVTRTRKSNHTKGIAVDIAFKGKELYPKSSTTREVVAQLANKYGIDWGYDLRKRDKPHFQDSKKVLSDVVKPKCTMSVGWKKLFDFVLSRNRNTYKKSQRKDEKKLLNNMNNAIREYLEFVK